MNNVPTPISCDETLLPGGPRVLYAPQPKPVDDGTAWYAGALGLVFFLGFFLALLAVGVANRAAGRAPSIIQPALLEPPTLVVQPLCNPRFDKGCTK